jgi:hypothetical protein
MPAPLDLPEVKDGDGRIRGFRSAPQSTALPPGIAARLENFRCGGESARVRKGPKAVATGLTLSNPAVVLSFTLGVMRDALSLTRTGGTARLSYNGTEPAGLAVGQYIKVRGASPANYNGTVALTAKSAPTALATALGTWVARSAVASGWRAIEWSPSLGLFAAVAFASADRVMTSPDGITWTARTAAEANGWRGIAWSPSLGLFAAVSTDGVNRVMTSPDGITWTARAAAEANSWRGIAWSPTLGLFVAVAMDGTNRVMTSPDGITWTARAAALARAWFDVVWSPERGLFVAVANESGVAGSSVMTSPDGVTWTTRTAIDSNWTSVAWGGQANTTGMFVAVGDSGIAMRSSDGMSWTQCVIPEGNTWRDVAWSPGINAFVAVAITGTNRVMSSPDGVTWTARAAAEANSWQALAWSPALGLFAAASSDGANRVMTSTAFAYGYVEYAVSGAPATPATGTIRMGTGPRIFNTYADQVHVSGLYTADDNTEGLVLATTDKAAIYREGVALATVNYPAGENVETTDDCTIEQYLGQVFLCRGRQGRAIGVVQITRSGATVTVETTAAHLLAAANRVRIAGCVETDYNGDWDVAGITDASHFTYTVATTPTSPATGTPTCVLLKVVLRWDRNTANAFVRVDKSAPPGGKIRFPETGWIIEHNRRLVGELSRDEVVPSDFGKYDEWTRNEILRFRVGAADWLIGAHPIHRTSWLALYANTVHQAFFDVTNLAPSGTELITGAPGCKARGSIRTCGSAVLYLSENGVHALRINSQGNVQAEAEPLSRFIQDYIDRINWAYAHRAVSAYHANGYYIALPLDGATKNNVLIKFNFLNPSADSPLGEWESVDTFVNGFDVRGLHVMKYEGQNRLHATTSYGYIFPLEVLEADEFGGPGSPTIQTYQIAGRLETRQTYAGDEAVKSWQTSQVEVGLQIGDTLNIEAATRNPDTTKTIYTHTSLTATDKTLRPRIRCQKGVTAGLVITTSAGRPEIRGWQVKGVTSDRSNRSKE